MRIPPGLACRHHRLQAGLRAVTLYSTLGGTYTYTEPVLALSKINFNSCLFSDRLPVTLRFANAIGEILVAAPLHAEPMLLFKHYM